MSTTSYLRPVRHKNQLLIPEINTYARQMQQCQKRSAQLPLENDDKLKLSNCPQDIQLPTINKRLIPRICVPSQPNRRDSFQYRVNGTRKGSLFSTYSKRHSKSYLPSTNCSSRKQSLGSRDPDSFTSMYMYGDVHRNSGQFLAAHKDAEIKTPDSKCSDTIPQERNSRKAQVVKAVHPHQEYLLHALTTLAINSLTSNLTPGDESERRLTAINHMSHLLLTKEKTIEEGEEHGKFIFEAVAKSDSFESVSDGTSKLDEILDTMENATHTDPQYSLADGQGINKVNYSHIKRSRINQLRNYLRVSGFGEPTVIVSSGPQADQFRLARLLQRMRRNDNPQRQERLRLRARLDYEMSLMRAASFCVQQEQIFFRSASVNMENTDMQMLEDDLKYQALLEMRRNDREMRDDGRKSYVSSICPGAKNNGNGNSTNTQGKRRASQDNIDSRGQVVNRTRPQGAANPRQASSYGSSLGYSEADIMSGVLGSPLSKKELMDRIHYWLAGVSEAMSGTTEIPLGHSDKHCPVY